MRDVSMLPEPVQEAAVVHVNGEVMWPVACAEAAIVALAEAGQIVLGLDLRSDGPNSRIAPNRLATEIPVSSAEPDTAREAVQDARDAAITTLHRQDVGRLVREGYAWVLITWRPASRPSDTTAE